MEFATRVKSRAGAMGCVASVGGVRGVGGVREICSTSEVASGGANWDRMSFRAGEGLRLGGSSALLNESSIACLCFLFIANQFLYLPDELVERKRGRGSGIYFDHGLLASGSLTHRDEPRYGRVEDELFGEFRYDLCTHLLIEILPRRVDCRERHHELVGGVRRPHLCYHA